MRILFPVDQKRCLELGIDAPTSTVQIEIDPATLTTRERQVLAGSLKDGHRYEGYEAHSIEGVDIAAVRAELGRRIAEDDAREADRAKRKSILLARLGERMDRGIVSAREKIRIHHYGQLHSYGDALSREVEVAAYEESLPGEGYSVGESVRLRDEDVPPEMLARHRALVEEAKSRHAATIEVTLADMRKELAANLEVEEIEKAKTEREYKALEARLPAGLRARMAAGFAALSEVRSKIESLIIADQYPTYTPTEQSHRGDEPVKQLTDSQFEALKRVRETMPEGAELTVVHEWNQSYRPVEDDEQGDADGEVRVKTDKIVVALVSWTRGGVRVEASFDLGS